MLLSPLLEGFALFSTHFGPAQSSILYVLTFILVTTIARIIFHYYEISLIPESALIIVLGALFGLILYAADSLLAVFQFNSDAFFLILIPPIILEAGYFLQKDLFFKNIGTILLYALVATFVGTFLVAFSLWACTSFLNVDYTLVELLVFGSLISAVDPIAVLAIFEEIHVNETLNILAFGESVVNDAVSIVLYRLFVSLQTTQFTVGIGFLAVIKFIFVAFGGIAIGVLSALGSAMLTKYTGHIPVVEPLIVLTMAYMSYILAEIFELSGIMAILFCGICMSHYTENNITHKSHTTIKYFMKMFAATAETVVFMFLGVSFIQGASGLAWDFGFTVLTYMFCMLFRAGLTFGLTWVANHYRLVPIPIIDQFVLFFGGLRGAIAFALAFILNSDFAARPCCEKGISKSECELISDGAGCEMPGQSRQRDIVLTSTLVIIMITVFIHGATMKPLLNWLKVARSTKERFAERSLSSHVLPQVVDPLISAVQSIIGKKGIDITAKGSWWNRLDNKVKSWVLRVNSRHDDKMADMLDALNFKIYRDVYEEVKHAQGLPECDAHDEIIKIAETIQNPRTRELDQLCDEFSKERPEVDHPYQYAVSQRDMRDFHRHHKEIPTGIRVDGNFSYSGYSSEFTSISYYSESEDDNNLYPPGSLANSAAGAENEQARAPSQPGQSGGQIDEYHPSSRHHDVNPAPATPAHQVVRAGENGVVAPNSVRRGNGIVHVVTMQHPSPPSDPQHGLNSPAVSQGTPDPPRLAALDTSTPPLQRNPAQAGVNGTPPVLVRSNDGPTAQGSQATAQTVPTAVEANQRIASSLASSETGAIGKRSSADSLGAELVPRPSGEGTPPTPGSILGKPPPSPDRSAPPLSIPPTGATTPTAAGSVSSPSGHTSPSTTTTSNNNIVSPAGTGAGGKRGPRHPILAAAALRETPMSARSADSAPTPTTADGNPAPHIHVLRARGGSGSEFHSAPSGLADPTGIDGNPGIGTNVHTPSPKEDSRSSGLRRSSSGGSDEQANLALRHSTGGGGGGSPLRRRRRARSRNTSPHGSPQGPGAVPGPHTGVRARSPRTGFDSSPGRMSTRSPTTQLTPGQTPPTGPGGARRPSVENAFGTETRRKLDKLDSNLAAFLVATGGPSPGPSPSGVGASAPPARSPLPSGNNMGKAPQQSPSPIALGRAANPLNRPAGGMGRGRLAPAESSRFNPDTIALALQNMAMGAQHHHQAHQHPHQHHHHHQQPGQSRQAPSPTPVAEVVGRRRPADDGAIGQRRRRTARGGRRSSRRRRSVDSMSHDEGLEMANIRRPRSVAGERYGYTGSEGVGGGADSVGPPRAASQVEVDVDSTGVFGDASELGESV